MKHFFALYFTITLLVTIGVFASCKQEEGVNSNYTFKSDAVSTVIDNGATIEEDAGLWFLKMPSEIPITYRGGEAFNLVGFSGIGGFQGPPTLKFKSVQILDQSSLYVTSFSPNPMPVLANGTTENLPGITTMANFIHNAITSEGYTVTGVCVDVEADINVELYEFSVFLYISTVTTDMVARVLLEYSIPNNPAQTLFFDPFPTTMQNPFACDFNTGGLVGTGGN